MIDCICIYSTVFALQFVSRIESTLTLDTHTHTHAPVVVASAEIRYLCFCTACAAQNMRASCYIEVFCFFWICSIQEPFLSFNKTSIDLNMCRCVGVWGERREVSLSVCVRLSVSVLIVRVSVGCWCARGCVCSVLQTSSCWLWFLNVSSSLAVAVDSALADSSHRFRCLSNLSSYESDACVELSRFSRTDPEDVK